MQWGIVELWGNWVESNRLCSGDLWNCREFGFRATDCAVGICGTVGKLGCTLSVPNWERKTVPLEETG